MEYRYAYFAGGCFGCITPIYKMYGAEEVVCGYAGGDEENPRYEDVKAQKTGHRETVMVKYDPEEVSYGTLLDIYFANVDPFDSEGQYIDKGFSYTLAIFYTSEEERALAEKKIRAVEEEQGKKCAVALLPYKNFYRAEEYHQDYYLKEPEAFERELLESGRKKKAYIFDLDGTLLDTLEDLAAAVNYALKKGGYPERSLAEVRSFVGDGMRLLMKRSLPEGVSEEVLDSAFKDFRDYYSVHYMDRTRPYPGIEEMLKGLKEKGRVLCVISNKADFAVKLLMDRFFPGIFSLVLGEREGIRRKPAPDSLLAVMDELGLEKRECIYIGDSDTDIQTAENAGIDHISVSWGFRTEEFLKARGAGKIVSSPEEILP